MASVTETNRNISDLTATAQTALKLLAQECYKAGIKDIFVTETYRPQERQNYLYTQGRTRSGKIVTWTKSSIHTSKRAWDLAIAPPKDLYDAATFAKVGAIATKLGIEWGGSWKKTPDKPHFQIDSKWSIPKGYSIEGTVIVSNSSKVPTQFTSNKTTVKPQTVIKEITPMTNEKIEFLNATGRDAYKSMIKAGVAEGLFTSKHEKVSNYTDTELLSFGAAYIARKLAKIK